MKEKTQLIKNSIIRYFGVDFDKNTRKREKHYLRCLYFRLVRDNVFLSYSEIGASLDHKKDHATVMHSLKVFKDTVRKYEPQIMEFYYSFAFVGVPVVVEVDLLEGKIKTMLNV